MPTGIFQLDVVSYSLCISCPLQGIMHMESQFFRRSVCALHVGFMCGSYNQVTKKPPASVHTAEVPSGGERFVL